MMKMAHKTTVLLCWFIRSCC